ncbi:MAG TPA: MarR family transcriptional regulator [Streptosporangiaceae bacterium]
MEQTGLMAEQAQTRWLSESEQQAWRAFLNACRRLFPEMDAHLQHVAGIPHAYYEILVRLSEAPGRELRMTQLADASTSSKSRLSHAVARLEARGWIERLACPTDRRGQIARLTDAGFAALDAAAHQHVDQVRRMVFDQLTPAQVEQLAAISAAIEAGVDELSSSPAAEACRAEAEARDSQAGTGAGAGALEPLEADGDSCPL